MAGNVYILKDKLGRFYVGSTSDLPRRLKQHTRNHTYTTTRMLHPSLVLSQEYDSRIIARRVERRIKKLKRKDYIERIVKDGFIKLKV